MRREAQNEIYVQLFQTPDEAEEVGLLIVKVPFLRLSPYSWEDFGPFIERQEDNIRKLRKVAAGDEAESDKA